MKEDVEKTDLVLDALGGLGSRMEQEVVYQIHA